MIHQNHVTEEWYQETEPFDELMLAWNGERPLDGKYYFHVSVYTQEWSPYLLYASWGSDGQKGCASTAHESGISIYQDALAVSEGKARGFRVKVITEGDASISKLRSLHTYINSGETRKEVFEAADSIHLTVSGLSQMALCHPRYKDLCSPTSTTAVLRYLCGRLDLDPVAFAGGVWDGEFDIFGNWVFNVVEASRVLGPSWQCWVERLHGFSDIYRQLQEGIPVVVSVRGPLTGSAFPYKGGHLIVVMGYDAENRRVLCMDPAFPLDSETCTSYDFEEFIAAWARRGNIAYIFSKNKF